MKNLLILATILLVGCKEKSKQSVTEKIENSTVTTDSYELVKAHNSIALLILFPAGGTTSKETEENFKQILKVPTLMYFQKHPRS
jgi:type IV pilus biogenesis protein CpaD/CtpE